MIYRYRCGMAWRDLPSRSGRGKTVWKRHRRFSQEAPGTRSTRRCLPGRRGRRGVEWSGR
ncbi:hypothetical protein [Ornithinimicrobium tianjinense]|uniref:hypothetical protein n=1 Tax=Ornithinimicrobium tianjinense TaxID=1195761 RepID=UPI003530C00B